MQQTIGFVPLGRILRAATCNLQSTRRTAALDPLPGGQPAFCEPQSASCRPSARCTSQIAARRIDARHVRMVSTELLGLAANPRAAIRELWASRKPQLADCSSQHRGQACAEARLQLAEHRSQLADRGAGSPVPPIAACTSQLARRRLLRRGSKADPILLSQNRRPHSRRSQHFGQEVKADPILLSQNRRPHSRRSQHFGQEVKADPILLSQNRRPHSRTVADRSTLARRSRQRSTVVRTLAVRWSQGAGV